LGDGSVSSTRKSMLCRQTLAHSAILWKATIGVHSKTFIMSAMMRAQAGTPAADWDRQTAWPFLTCSNLRPAVLSNHLKALKLPTFAREYVRGPPPDVLFNQLFIY
jgi:hypothetical protein